MARKAAGTERGVLADAFSRANNYRLEKKEARRKKFEPSEKGDYKKKRQIKPKKEKLGVEMDFPKRKKKLSKEIEEKNKNTDSSKLNKLEIDIKKIDDLERRLSQVNNEINDVFFDKPFLSQIHSEGVKEYLIRGGLIFDRIGNIQKIPNYEEDVEKINEYLREGTWLLNFLRRTYKDHIDNQEIGGADYRVEEEMVGNKESDTAERLDEDIIKKQSPKSPVYLEAEVPEDSKEAHKKYHKPMKPKSPNQVDEISKSENGEKERSEIIETDRLDGEKTLDTEIPKFREDEEMNERVSFTVKSYLKGAVKMLDVIRNSGIYDFSGEEEEKTYIRRYLRIAIDEYEKNTDEEKELIIETVINKLYQA